MAKMIAFDEEARRALERGREIVDHDVELHRAHDDGLAWPGKRHLDLAHDAAGPVVLGSRLGRLLDVPAGSPPSSASERRLSNPTVEDLDLWCHQ